MRKKGEIAFLQLQLDGTHVFSDVTVTFLPFFFFCVSYEKRTIYKKIGLIGWLHFFTKSCIISNAEQVLLITFL